MPKSRSIDQFKRNAARRLRQNATNAETLLWRHLKRLGTRGTHFRRQMPVGNYIVDFACPAGRLVIEVDGSQHGEGETKVRDRMRTQWLEGEGYRVLRFWNNDIRQNLPGVMELIYVSLYGSREAESRVLKHARRRRSAGDLRFTPPRRAARADPPPPGEGD